MIKKKKKSAPNKKKSYISASKKKINKNCIHQFTIIKGSGKKTGVSTWKCLICKEKIKSN
jgi:hypothetical protein